MSVVNILRDNTTLTIFNPPKEVLKFLKITNKSIELVEKEMPNGYIKRERKVVRRVVPLYNVLNEKDPLVVQTHHGFWHDVCNIVWSQGMEVKMHDKCFKPTSPDLTKMIGFRFSQRELLVPALRQEISGLIGAPTRYGKTYLMINTLRAYPTLTTVVTAPGVDLINQLYNEIKAALPYRDIKLIGGGSKTRIPSEDITVCSMDSLHKCDAGRVELMLIDEPHAIVTNSRFPKFAAFNKARFLGFGATLKGRFDGRDKLIKGLIGPVIAERTYLEAVYEGAIAPLVILFLNTPLAKTKFKSRDKIYNHYMFLSLKLHKMIKEICYSIIPKEWQTLVFIKHEKQADRLLEVFNDGEGVIAMAKKLTKKQRVDITERMATGKITRCLASDIYAQGVTFSNVRCLVNSTGGGANTTTIQKPGRLAEIIDGKSCGVIFDFDFYTADGDNKDAAQVVIRDCKKRREAYVGLGYLVYTCDSLTELETKFKEVTTMTREQLVEETRRVYG